MKAESQERVAHGFPRQRMVVLPRPVVDDALRRPMTSAILPTDVGFFPSASAHFIERRVGVAQAILVYCVRGEGWAELGGERFTIGADSILLVPPGQPHQYGAAMHRPWTIYWAHVTGSGVAPLLNAIGVRPAGSLLPVRDPRALVPLFEQILAPLDAGDTRQSLLVASLAAGHLFGHLIAQRGTVADADGVNHRLDATVAFMKRSVGGVLSVAELAAMAKLSPSHFAVLFKRKTGYPVLDFFIRLKMREACRLLDMTTLPIKAIADRLTYHDPLYFSRAFHKVMGLAPRDYRATHKG